MTAQPAQGHKAVLIVTSRSTRKDVEDLVAGAWMHPILEHLQSARVTVRGFSSTPPRGILNGPQLFRNVRQAQQPNWQPPNVFVRLLRAVVADNLLPQVLPSQSSALPCRLSVRAITEVIRRVDPNWTALRLTGSLIRDLPVADHVEQTYAPILERCTAWSRGRPPKTRNHREGSEVARRLPVVTTSG